MEKEGREKFVTGVVNENEKGRGVEGLDAADISSHTLNLRSSAESLTV